MTANLLMLAELEGAIGALAQVLLGKERQIRLALSCGKPALLLIDERAGRAVAQDLGISVAGTAAVIGQARQRGLIASARDVFAALHASDFRMAPGVIGCFQEEEHTPVSGNVPDQLCTPSRPKHIASLDTYGRVNPWHQAMADDIFGGMTPKGNVA